MNDQITCVVCGKAFPKASGNVQSYQGKPYNTCSPLCRDRFNKSPRLYAKEDVRLSQKHPTAQPAPPTSGQATPPKAK